MPNIHYHHHHADQKLDIIFQKFLSLFESTSFFKNLISNYNKGFNKSKWWFRSQRNTSNRSKPFLTISDGHYGLYYSMYNHDSERQQRQKDHEKYIKHMILKQLETSDRILGHKSLNSETFFARNQYHQHHHMVNCFMGRYRGRQNSKNSNGRSHYHRRRCPHHHGFHLKLLLIGFTAKFLISKAMVDTQINLDGIKKFSSKLFSSFAYKPFNYSFASFTRLATVTKNTTISNEKNQNWLQHFVHHYPRFSQRVLSKEHLQHLLNNNKTMKDRLLPNNKTTTISTTYNNTRKYNG